MPRMNSTPGQLYDLSTLEDTSTGDRVFSYFLFLGLLLQGVFIILGNMLTVLAILTTPELRTQSNCYVFHLAIADGIVGFASLLWSISHIDLAFDRSEFLCLTGYVITVISAGQSLITLTLLAFDRLLYVERPYFYARIITESLTHRILICSWLFSLTYGIFVPIYYNSFNPEIGCVSFKVIDSKATLVAYPLPILSTALITSACYIRISCIARRHQKKIRIEVRLVGSQLGQNSSTQGSSSTNSSATIFKSIGLFVTINCVFVLCWLPSVVCSLLPSRMQTSTAMAFFLFLAISNSGMNFIIYACKNEQFACAYRKLLKRCLGK